MTQGVKKKKKKEDLARSGSRGNIFITNHHLLSDNKMNIAKFTMQNLPLVDCLLGLAAEQTWSVRHVLYELQEIFNILKFCPSK